MKGKKSGRKGRNIVATVEAEAKSKKDAFKRGGRVKEMAVEGDDSKARLDKTPRRMAGGRLGAAVMPPEPAPGGTVGSAVMPGGGGATSGRTPAGGPPPGRGGGVARSGVMPGGGGMASGRAPAGPPPRMGRRGAVGGREPAGGIGGEPAVMPGGPAMGGRTPAGGLPPMGAPGATRGNAGAGFKKGGAVKGAPFSGKGKSPWSEARSTKGPKK